MNIRENQSYKCYISRYSQLILQNYMKILQIVVLSAVLISFCYSDPVNCSQIQGSPIGKIASCTSMHPFPLKVTSTVTLTMSYAWESWSWTFFLRNYKGQMVKVDGCIIINPTYAAYNIGANLTIGITCYQLPRQLSEGDYIHINFFAQQASYKLVFLIPILGYSSIQSINQHQNELVQTSNKSVADPVQCVKIQPSKSTGLLQSCSSVHPFPLKVSSTIVIIGLSGYDFKAKSWLFYLRSYKGELTKVDNCIITNPRFALYFPGKKLTISITCYQLPRQLTQGDFIHITFFDDLPSEEKLIFLIPILGYSSSEQYTNYQNQLSQTVQCQRVLDSIKAAYVNCTSTKPFPLKVTTTVTLLKDNAFIASSDWRFWLRQAKGQIMKVDNCTLSNPPSGSYKKGDNLTVGITCYQLPRDLKQWDSIQVSFYQVDNLTFLIPILGYNLYPQQEQVKLQQNQGQIQEIPQVQKTSNNQNQLIEGVQTTFNKKHLEIQESIQEIKNQIKEDLVKEKEE